MLSHPDYELVAAVDENDGLLAWMSLAIRIRIEDVSFLQVAALVTDQSVRGKGIGPKLNELCRKNSPSTINSRLSVFTPTKRELRLTIFTNISDMK